MPVVITLRETNKPLIYKEATSATIVSTGHLQLYRVSEGNPDKQLGAVTAGAWISYRIIDSLEEEPEVETPQEPVVETPQEPVVETPVVEEPPIAEGQEPTTIA